MGKSAYRLPAGGMTLGQRSTGSGHVHAHERQDWRPRLVPTSRVGARLDELDGHRDGSSGGRPMRACRRAALTRWWRTSGPGCSAAPKAIPPDLPGTAERR